MFGVEQLRENNDVKTTRTYVLAAYNILLGILAFTGWLYIGQADDAPGAGMIGSLALLTSLVVGYRIARARPVGEQDDTSSRHQG